MKCERIKRTVFVLVEVIVVQLLLLLDAFDGGFVSYITVSSVDTKLASCDRSKFDGINSDG